MNRTAKVFLLGGLAAAVATALVVGGHRAGADGAKETQKKLVIFHAGSLAVPFEKIGEAFEVRHPGVRVVREAAGSRACARKISDLGRRCDVMASADYSVINTLLMPEHAAWCIRFAANELVLAYREGAPGSDEIDAANWPDVLLREGVASGRSDPDSDPCGYRTVMALRLAEKYYGREGLAKRLLDRSAANMRPKEVDLLALLETGAIDYLYIYRSVAEQHGLHYLALPGEINLGDPARADLYGTVSVKVSGKQPGTEIVKTGAPMVYGVTIPREAPNPELARQFVRFLLSEDGGLAILQSCGQPSVVPAPSGTYRQVPDGLKEFCTRSEP